jgi:uncharacterized protein
MGEVNDNIVIDIPKITRQYNFYYEYLRKFCQTCHAYKFCGICLFHLKNIDNVDAEGFVCDNYYDQQDYKEHLCRIFSFIEKYSTDFSQIIENLIIE